MRKHKQLLASLVLAFVLFTLPLAGHATEGPPPGDDGVPAQSDTGAPAAGDGTEEETPPANGGADEGETEPDADEETPDSSAGPGQPSETPPAPPEEEEPNITESEYQYAAPKPSLLKKGYGQAAMAAKSQNRLFGTQALTGGAATGTLQLESSVNRADGGTVWMQLDGPVCTTVQLDASANQALEGLPLGAYTATLTLPPGYSLASASLNGSALGSGQVLSFTLQDAGARLTLAFTAAENSHLSSKDQVANRLTAGKWSKAYGVNISADPIRNDPAAVDIVFLLDFSQSMENGMDNTLYPEQYGMTSRIDYLRQNLKRTLDTLSEDPPEGSRFSIVTFNEVAYKKVGWTEFKNLNKASLYSQIDSWAPDKTTMSDRGFKAVREMFTQNPTQNERYVVYFTDGVSGSYQLRESASAGSYYFWNNESKYYTGNGFRVMAETLNQADILKGTRDTTITGVNNVMKGYGNSSAKVNYHGVYLGGNNNASTANSNWKGYASTSVTSMTTYDNQTGRNYSSVVGGNFARDGMGCGATVISLAIMNDESYKGEVPGIVDEYMRRVTTDPDHNYFLIKDADDFATAFEAMTARVSGVYKNAYVRYYVSSDFTVTQGSGYTTGTDAAGSYIEWGPLTFSPDDPLRKYIELEPKDPENTNPPSGALKICIVVNGTYVEINGQLPRKVVVTEK